MVAPSITERSNKIEKANLLSKIYGNIKRWEYSQCSISYKNENPLREPSPVNVEQPSQLLPLQNWLRPQFGWQIRIRPSDSISQLSCAPSILSFILFSHPYLHTIIWPNNSKCCPCDSEHPCTALTALP